MGPDKLAARLRAAAELVLPGVPAADIGSDHMYLPAYLARRRLCPHVIATDKAAAPCAKGRAFLAGLGLDGQVEVRRGDGLEVLTAGEVATIIVTGMGGCLIRDILAARPRIADSARRLVLSPQKDVDLLRYYLADSGWRIVDERLIYEAGIYYTVIAAEKGAMSLTADEARFGPCLLAQAPPLLTEMLNRDLEQVEGLLARVAEPVRREELQREKARLNEVIAQLEDR